MWVSDDGLSMRIVEHFSPRVTDMMENKQTKAIPANDELHLVKEIHTGFA